MGLIKKAIAIGGIYYVAKKVHESHKETQNASAQQQATDAPYPQQQQQQQQQQPLATSRAAGHQSYCNGQCGGQCSFNASEQHGYDAKAAVYEEKALV
jgi:hypothetical protein